MEELIGYIPPITKYIAGGALLVTILITLGFVDEADLFFDKDQILIKHEIWRVFTSCLYFGSFDFGSFLHLLALFHHLKNLEVMSFHGQMAEFIWFLTLTWSTVLVLAPTFNLIFLSESFFMSILYLNCKKNREGRIQLLGIPFVIPNSFFPYLFLAFGVYKERVIGMAIAHIFYFFEDAVPNLPTSKNWRLLKPPGLVRKFASLVSG